MRSRWVLRMLLATVAVLTASVVFAIADERSFEYGEPDEMRGLTKLHIDTGPDADLYRIMRNVIEKREPRITVVPTEDAEFTIILTRDMNRDSRGRRYFMGELHVVRFGETRVRLLSTYRHDEEELDDLADEIVKAFLKEYRRVNTAGR